MENVECGPNRTAKLSNIIESLVFSKTKVVTINQIRGGVKLLGKVVQNESATLYRLERRQEELSEKINGFEDVTRSIQATYNVWNRHCLPSQSQDKRQNQI